MVERKALVIRSDHRPWASSIFIQLSKIFLMTSLSSDTVILDLNLTKDR